MFQFRLRTLLVGVTLWAAFWGLISILGSLGPLVFFLGLFAWACFISDRYVRRSAMTACGGAVAMCSGLPLAPLGFFTMLLGFLPTMIGLIALLANLMERESPQPVLEDPSNSKEQR